MPAKTKGWIGVDFGVRSIKIAQVEREGEAVRLTGAAIVERGSERQNNSIPEWSPSEIRAALALEPSFRGRSSACVLGLAQTGVRMLTVPPGTDSERRTMIRHQLEDSLGAHISQCEFDFWDCGETSEPAGDEQNIVGVTYVYRNRAAEVARNVERAGLSCEVLDGQPLALARAAVLAGAAQGENVAVVDWGYSNATLSIVRDAAPRFFRVLRDCGFAATLTAVADALGLTVQDAQQLLTLYGLGNETAIDATSTEIKRLLSDAIGQPLLAYQKQLETTLNHLRLHRPALVPQRIILLGGGATVCGIDHELSVRLDLPVSLWKLASDNSPSPSIRSTPEPMLAGAAALSALAWKL